MQAEVASPLYLGALVAPRNALVDPVRLVDGLRAEAMRRGVRLFEDTAVQGFEFPADRVVVETAGGRVRARRAVLATNAYSHHLFPRLAFRFLPLYDYILVSEPLTPAQRAAIGWKGRQAIVDARTFFNYYRLTADGRILWGTSEAAYYPGNRVDAACDHSPKHYADLRASFRRHFPQLGGSRVPVFLGRTDRLDHPPDAVLRHAGRPAVVRARVHGPRHRLDAGGGEDPRAPRARSEEPAAGVVDGAPQAVSLSAGAAAAAGGRGGDALAAQGGCGREAGVDVEGARRDGDQLLELSGAGRARRAVRERGLPRGAG